MTDNLMTAFANASEIEKQAFMAVMVKNTTSNETYQALKQFDAEKSAEANKQAEYERGYKLRDEAAKHFNEMYPNT